MPNVTESNVRSSHFRRERSAEPLQQLVIGEHIVDFAYTKVRLVVEVDGEGLHGASLRERSF